jgi:hypothetical protein
MKATVDLPKLQPICLPVVGGPVISAANVAPLHAVVGIEHEAVEEDISEAAHTVVFVIGHRQGVLRLTRAVGARLPLDARAG